jgi:far upstream element-binding protein
VLAALHEAPAGGGGGGGGGGGAPLPHAAFHAFLSDDRAGALIGKGGATIRELQQRTGCRIQVAAAPDAEGRRLVSVAGPPAGVEAAKAEVLAIAARP